MPHGTSTCIHSLIEVRIGQDAQKMGTGVPRLFFFNWQEYLKLGMDCQSVVIYRSTNSYSNYCTCLVPFDGPAFQREARVRICQGVCCSCFEYRTCNDWLMFIVGSRWTVYLCACGHCVCERLPWFWLLTTDWDLDFSTRTCWKKAVSHSKARNS